MTQFHPQLPVMSWHTLWFVIISDPPSGNTLISLGEYRPKRSVGVKRPVWSFSLMTGDLARQVKFYANELDDDHISRSQRGKNEHTWDLEHKVRYYLINPDKRESWDVIRNNIKSWLNKFWLRAGQKAANLLILWTFQPNLAQHPIRNEQCPPTPPFLYQPSRSPFC